MPRSPFGTRKTTRAGVLTIRIPVLGKRHTFHLASCQTDEAVIERQQHLAQLALSLRTHADRVAVVNALEDVAAAKPGQPLLAALDIAARLAGGTWHPSQSKAPTFGQVFERWQNNELALDYPDDIKPRAVNTTIRAAQANYNRYIKRHVHDVPVDQVGDRHADAIKAGIPTSMRRDGRRHILGMFAHVLDLCVLPLKLIARSPLPAKWRPKREGPRTLQWIRPKEDARVMACTDNALWERLLFGTYNRVGARSSELLTLTLERIDLEDVHGASFRLRETDTKTDTERGVPLDYHTARALVAWVALARADAEPGDRVFITDRATKVVAKTVKLPKRLRACFKRAGVARGELYLTTQTSRQLVVHDCRASFCIVALANGWTEQQVMTYTGHEGSEQLATYRRKADFLKATRGGYWAPLDEVIPEIAAWWAAREDASTLADCGIAVCTSPRCAAAREAERNQRSATQIPKYATSLRSLHSIVQLPGASQARGMLESQAISRDARALSSSLPGSDGSTMAERLRALAALLHADDIALLVDAGVLAPNTAALLSSARKR